MATRATVFNGDSRHGGWGVARSAPAIVLLAVVACATATPLGCTTADPPPLRAPDRPDVLLVTLDTTRADHTSAYGYRRPTTPRLEELAARGVRFDVAYAPMPTTLPSHASMLTGLLPRTHGTLKNGMRFDPSIPVIAEVLASAGYRTAAFVSSFPLLNRFGLARGFSVYDDDFGSGGCFHRTEKARTRDPDLDSCRRADLTTASALRWLEASGYLEGEGSQRYGEAPFFLWIHFFDAHAPYDPPEAHARLFPPSSPSPADLDRDIARYDAEIHFADAEMGRLLDRLAAADRLSDTMVMVVGDHGEGLMDHGRMSHGFQLYEEAVRVPFVVAWPAKLPAGTVIDAPVAVADVAPTILDMVGATMPDGHRRLDGVSLLPAMQGATTLSAERPVVVQRRHYARKAKRGVPVLGEMYGLRSGEWKYIEASEEGSVELYHLPTDPRERANLAAVQLDQRRRLHEQLASILATPVRPLPSGSVPRISESDARRLEALGYVE